MMGCLLISLHSHLDMTQKAYKATSGEKRMSFDVPDSKKVLCKLKKLLTFASEVLTTTSPSECPLGFGL